MSLLSDIEVMGIERRYDKVTEGKERFVGYLYGTLNYEQPDKKLHLLCLSGNQRLEYGIDLYERSNGLGNNCGYLIIVNAKRIPATFNKDGSLLDDYMGVRVAQSCASTLRGIVEQPNYFFAVLNSELPQALPVEKIQESFEEPSSKFLIADTANIQQLRLSLRHLFSL